MLIKKLIIGLTVIGSFSACNKMLDVKPESQLDANDRFKNLDDYNFSLLGTYSLFRNTSYYGATDAAANAFATLPDMLADDLLSNPLENLGNELVFSRWLYTSAETQIENAWTNAYAIISQANITLQGIDRFADKDQGRVNRIKAQALAIRALVHFDILRYWVNDYTAGNAPGIPYMDKFDYEQKPARGTVAQTFTRIEKDLLDAKALMHDMDDNINGAGSPAYIDELGVDAILARMYLYKGSYDKAIEFSTYVIDAVPFSNKAVFDKIWQDAEFGELIWSVSFNAGQGGPGNNAYAPDIKRSQYSPNAALMNAYDQANDVRWSAYFGEREDRGGNVRDVLIKYEAKAASLAKPDGTVNFKALRVAEQYLIRAEAYAKSTTPDEAAAMDDLNALRAARIYGYVDESLTGQALLNAIELERRKELVAEGHRFFDLKRKGVTARKVDRAGSCATCDLPADSYRWAWPIPRNEIDANPAIKPQNDGYGN
ncbi:MAG: RagB/SusD family nutrient uptake outer membrane protein [Chitinophagaceae bacterium]|nr:RagB/SusD family nutrient uptake outer membrane protein [Chitinophagaceae bacterium]